MLHTAFAVDPNPASLLECLRCFDALAEAFASLKGASDKISAAEVQISVPRLSSSKLPAPRGSQGADGTTNTFLFNDLAQRAVDSAPERWGACTITTEGARAAISRFLRRNSQPCGRLTAGAG